MADTDDADACPECGHAWISHTADGCIAWPPGEPVCTCKAKPPGDGDE